MGVVSAPTTTPEISVTEQADLPEQMKTLAKGLEGDVHQAVEAIGQINLQVRLLSFNAQIEAARAGEAGRSFGVVSEEMVRLSDHIKTAVGQMLSRTEHRSESLARLSETLASDIRGKRLADLAVQAIDVIDRNLYERSCDVRWWATDKAVVDVLQDDADETAIRYATERLATILKAYTVYFDIVVTDLKGRVVVNGRPGDYRSIGTEQGQTEWFRSAMATSDGVHFGFQSVHASPLVKNERVLVYSCKICGAGNAHNAPVGVLGVVFRWKALAQTIVEAIGSAQNSLADAVVAVVDPRGQVLATTKGLDLDATLPTDLSLLSKGKTYMAATLGSRPGLIAHAPSVGYETYKTGWSVIIFQPG